MAPHVETAPRLSVTSLFIGTAVVALIYLQFAIFGFVAIAILAIENILAALGLLLYNKWHSANLAVATALLIYCFLLLTDYDAQTLGEALRFSWFFAVSAVITQVLVVFLALTTHAVPPG